MKSILQAVLVAAAAAGAAGAQERLELNIVYPLNEERIQLRDSIFFTQDNRGGYEVVEGGFDGGPARCIGSGFGYKDGTSTIGGLCIFGEGADTFSMSWKFGEKGAANTWTIVDGTGRFEGMTGEGIATTTPETMYKALPLRKTHVVGMVTIPAR